MSANPSQAASGPVHRALFAGAQVRRLRSRLQIGQAAMAQALGISTSYLSQIESSDRPLTPNVLASIANCYPDEWALVDPESEAALYVEANEACSDSSIPDAVSDQREVNRLVRQQPVVTRRVLALHAAYRQAQEQLRVLDEQLSAVEGGTLRLPWDQVRDWFHTQNNYVDPIDREAERIANELASGGRHAAIIDRLHQRFGVSVEFADGAGAPLRAFDHHRKTLRLDASQPTETTLFSLAHQLGRLELAGHIAAIGSSAISSEAGRELLAAGLSNYAAGALLMPYERFRDGARDCRHDVDRLRQRFGTSFEQTCHRLSTMQRPGAIGLPVFFCRVDMAGNITKRHSATQLQFAQFGGACPLWIVHEAVAIPDRISVQLAEAPGGTRYIFMAKGLVKPSGSFARPPRRYAVALGCEEAGAAEFIYADALGVNGTPTLIGSSCRICPRSTCDQRAFPPAASQIHVDLDRRGAVPYLFT